jgi:ABC-type polysaccharide/polyol phosphate transport system ATPase subunit
MTADNLPSAMAAPVSTPVSDAPVVIEARGLDKAFRIPSHRVDSLKERMIRPFTRADYRELQALRDISFDVHRGEFFGIVGRNGSGKSSLLKVMASIYRADAGRIRMAGRVAPFIELGVGFNPELTARDNVLLNGVMMGLTRREAAERLDTVLEFAELEDFVEMKLKNYSSGMMVRLAFAVMVQADADIMLIDEVLAVGDAAFSQKCMDVFHEKRRAGKTIVLVTHDMASVQALCHRAMLIHDGELRYIGDPEETAMRYYRLNFGGADGRVDDGGPRAVPDVHVRLVEASFEDASGSRVDNVEQGTPIRLNVVLEAREELASPIFAVHVLNADGATVFGFRTRLTGSDPHGTIPPGGHVRISGTIENPLVPGRYFTNCHVYREGSRRGALQVMHLPGFVVFGTAPGPGLVSVKTDVEAVAEKEPQT